MTTKAIHLFRRHHSTSRKEPDMHHIDVRFADVRERQALLRTIRDQGRLDTSSRRTIRRQVGESLVRLGRRIGGDATTTPAWQG